MSSSDEHAKELEQAATQIFEIAEKALSDGPQALLPEQFDDTFKQLQKVAQVFGRTFS